MVNFYDLKLGSYICYIHHNSYGSYDIYYDEDIIGCQSTIQNINYVCTSLTSPSKAFYNFCKVLVASFWCT